MSSPLPVRPPGQQFRYPLRCVRISSDVFDALAFETIAEALKRHFEGDFGDVEAARESGECHEDPAEMLSKYDFLYLVVFALRRSATFHKDGTGARIPPDVCPYLWRSTEVLA